MDTIRDIIRAAMRASVQNRVKRYPEPRGHTRANQVTESEVLCSA